MGKSEIDRRQYVSWKLLVRHNQITNYAYKLCTSLLGRTVGLEQLHAFSLVLPAANNVTPTLLVHLCALYNELISSYTRLLLLS